ncbi:hypothetical protein BDA96_05G153700 [Sorghum bicolor]|uniref:Uncharacterized protein n=1 Tax=Sorghum bicolor TaxID=4558 RepID=A0A921UFV9_SORBI|nr:formin-like protein 8 [Sorghum bicolor]KAG0530079.1 hypothetical protein BDA96_05G153700 [Sorghum bicolor]|eukprot:XP_021318946.1 formin-like protein 8 [Sorghum bicolor]
MHLSRIAIVPPPPQDPHLGAAPPPPPQPRPPSRAKSRRSWGDRAAVSSSILQHPWRSVVPPSLSPYLTQPKRVPVIDAGDGVHVSSGASTNAVAEDEGAGSPEFCSLQLCR